MTRRVAMFVVIAGVSLLTAFGYGWLSAARSRAAVADRHLPALESAPQPVAATPSGIVETSGGVVGGGRAGEGDAGGESQPDRRVLPTMFVRHTGLDRSFGVMAVEQFSTPTNGRRASEWRCDRLYFARDRGVCLTTDRLYTTQSLIIFDEQFVERYRLPLSGLPSRARMSADGRLAATTVFVTGHSYSDGAFSTETNIIDTHSGALVAMNLQTWPVLLEGEAIRALDLNVWGVTFRSESDRFYATVGTGSHTYLVEGTLSARTMRVLRDGVECPSVSPDGRRIAFKKRVPGTPGEWRVQVMDVATLQDWPTAEVRGLDDQIEWLDNDRLIYGLAREGGPVAVTDVWSVSADGSGQPVLIAAEASSPSVIRTGRWAR